MAAFPSAMVSSNVRRGRPTVGQGSLEGDMAVVPAERKLAAVTQSSSSAHSHSPRGRRRCRALLSLRLLLPPGLRASPPSSPPEIPGWARPLSSYGGRGHGSAHAYLPARPAPRARPRTGCGSHPRRRTAPARSPPWPPAAGCEPPAPSAQLLPKATRRRQSTAGVSGRSPLVSGRGGGVGVAARAGRAGPSPTLELERRDPGALHWSARPPVCAVGGTWAGRRRD